jgi:hypothetical protein
MSSKFCQGVNLIYTIVINSTEECCGVGDGVVYSSSFSSSDILTLFTHNQILNFLIELIRRNISDDNLFVFGE